MPKDSIKNATSEIGYTILETILIVVIVIGVFAFLVKCSGG